MSTFDKFSILPICSASNFAFSCPICLIPKENISLSKEIFFDLFIAYFKFDDDKFPQPSNFDIFSKSKINISYGSLINFKSQNFYTTFLPNPSIFSASFEIKCLIFSTAIFSHE